MPKSKWEKEIVTLVSDMITLFFKSKAGSALKELIRHEIGN